MSDRHLFRDMRQRIALTKAQVGLLLGMPNVDWPHTQYAMFMTLESMTKGTENPSYAQMHTLVGVWLRFYKRLIDTLPTDNELRGKCQVEFDKLVKGYERTVE